MPKKPEMRLTPNQVVAWNLRRARHLRGWTQEEAAEHLEPFLGEHWSKAVFSVAERSSEGSTRRIRQFTADDIAALAAAFDLTIPFFFTPPVSNRTPVPAYGDYGVGPAGASRVLSAVRFKEMAQRPGDDEVNALAAKRVEELIDANPAFRALDDQVRSELGVDDSAEAQRQAGLRALRDGSVVRGKQGSAQSKS